MRRFLILLAALALAYGQMVLVSGSAQAAPEKIPAARLLSKLKVDHERNAFAYDRSKWDHWVVKKGKCDTRELVIAQESTKKVRKSRNCAVKSGQWINEYNGRTIRSPRSLEVDHRVALAEAWRSGGHRWNANMRRGFANDMYAHSLVAVGRAVNRAKSDSDPADWEPRVGKCKYAARWIAVKYRWNLSVDPVEKRALAHRLNTCSTASTMIRPPAKGTPEKKVKKKKPDNGGGNSMTPSGWDCPASHPIKGNASSMIYHMPSGAYYSRTNPEECFATESAARAAGYRRSKL